MPVLFLNCNSGISGDMFVGSLLDLKVSGDYLTSELKKLRLDNFRINIEKIKKNNVDATRFNVLADEETKNRDIKDIFEIVDNSDLSFQVKFLAKKIFSELAWAESIAHETGIEKVHFHDIGAIDSIVDIVSASILISKLEIKKIFYGHLKEGTGKVNMAHGISDLPVPAVRELLSNFNIEFLDINAELITPTGAAILKAMNAEHIEFETDGIKLGYGAGTKDFTFANVLEACILENIEIDEKILLETNIDDMNPEFFPYVIERLIKKGAVDAFISPAFMKKNRIGSKLTVICKNSQKEELIRTIFEETTTFGIRVNKLQRIELERKIIPIDTRFGIVNVKIGLLKGEIINAKPEYEECKKIAEKRDIPLKKAYEEIKEDINASLFKDNSRKYKNQ